LAFGEQANKTRTAPSSGGKSSYGVGSVLGSRKRIPNRLGHRYSGASKSNKCTKSTTRSSTDIIEPLQDRQTKALFMRFTRRGGPGSRFNRLQRRTLDLRVVHPLAISAEGLGPPAKDSRYAFGLSDLCSIAIPPPSKKTFECEEEILNRVLSRHFRTATRLWKV
jgi:hypothetical protein